MNERGSRIVCGIWCVGCAVLSILFYFKNGMMQPYLPIIEIALPIGMVILVATAWFLHWNKMYVFAEWISFCVTLFVMNGLYSIDRWKALWPGLFMIEADRWAVMSVVMISIFVLLLGIWFIRKRWQERGTNQSEKLFGLLLIWCFVCVAGGILSFFFYDQMRPLLIGIDIVGGLCILTFWGVSYFYLQVPEKYQYAAIGTMTGMTALICINRLYAGTTWKRLIPALEQVNSYWITMICLAIGCIAWLFGMGSVWMIQRGKRERGGMGGNGSSDRRVIISEIKKNKSGILAGFIILAGLIVVIVFGVYHQLIVNALGETNASNLFETLWTLAQEVILIGALVGSMIWMLVSFWKEIKRMLESDRSTWNLNDSIFSHMISICVVIMACRWGTEVFNINLEDVSGELSKLTGQILVPLLFVLLLILFETIVYHFIRFIPRMYEALKYELEDLKDIVLDYIYEIMKSIIEFILGIITSAVHFVASVPDFFDAFYELVFHEPNQIVRIIKIVSFMLAMVSWIATAQGLQQYIFTESEFQAYAVSFGIQGLLFVVNLNIMDYLMGNKGTETQEQEVHGATVRGTVSTEGTEGAETAEAVAEVAVSIPAREHQEKRGFRAILKDGWHEFGENIAKTIRGILRFPWAVWGKKMVLLRMLLLLCLMGLSSGFSYIYIVTMVYDDTKYADIDAKLQKEYQDIYMQTAEYANWKKAALLMDIYGTLGALSDTGGSDEGKGALIEEEDYTELSALLKKEFLIDGEVKSLEDKEASIFAGRPTKKEANKVIASNIDKITKLLEDYRKLPRADSETSSGGKEKAVEGVNAAITDLENIRTALERLQEKCTVNEDVKRNIFYELSKESPEITDIQKDIDALSKMVLENTGELGKSDAQLRIIERLYAEIDAFDQIANRVLSHDGSTENSLKELSEKTVPSVPIKNEYLVEVVEKETVEIEVADETVDVAKSDEEEIAETRGVDETVDAVKGDAGEKKKTESHFDEEEVEKWKEDWRARLDGLKAIIQILYETQGTMDALEEEKHVEAAATESATIEPAITEPAATEPVTTEVTVAVTESPTRTSILAGIVQWLFPKQKTSEEPVVSDQEVLTNNIHKLQDMERNYLGHVNVLEQGILYLTDGEYKNLAKVSLIFALAMDLFSMYAGYLTSLAWKEGEKKEKTIESGILKMKRK